MGQAINAAVDLKVEPSILYIRVKIQFFLEILWDVAYVHADILRSIEGCLQIEVRDIKADKTGSFAG